MVKNKPKRLDRARSWRVARRKNKIKLLLSGNPRNRNPRPKHKGRDLEESKPEDIAAPEKTAKKVVKAPKVVVEKETKSE